MVDELLAPDPRFIISESATGGDAADLLKPDPRYNIDIPKQDFDDPANTAKLAALVAEERAIKVKWTKTPEDEQRLQQIEKDKDFLTVPMFSNEFELAKIHDQRQGLEYATAPWELFFGITSGQTITRLGTASLKGVLTRAATIGSIAAVPIDILSTKVMEESPWLGLALGVGLSIPMAMYVDARIEEKIFRQILFKNPKFFSENLSKIVSVNYKNVSAQAKARIEVLKNRIGPDDYAAFIETQDILRRELYLEIDPVKLTKLPSENIKVPTRKDLNRAALKKSFADVSDTDLEEIQKLAQVQAISGFDKEFVKVRKKITDKLALDAYRNHPITGFTESVRREGGFSERLLTAMIGPEATASLKQRFPGVVQPSKILSVTDVAVAIVKKIAPDVNIVLAKNAEGLPQDIKEGLTRAGRSYTGIRGSFNEQRNRLVLVQAQFKNAADAATTGVHEILHTKMKRISLADSMAVYEANPEAIDRMARRLGMDQMNLARNTEEWLVREITKEMMNRRGAFSFSQLMREGIEKRKVPYMELMQRDVASTLGLKGQVNPIHKAVAYGYNSVEEMLYDWMQAPTLAKIKKWINKDMEFDWDILYLNEYAQRAGGAEMKMWERIGGKKLVQAARAAAKKDALLIGTKPKLLRHILDEVNFIRNVGSKAVKATMRTLKAQNRVTQLARAEAVRSSVRESREIGKITGNLKNALREKEIPYEYQVQVHGFLAPYVKGAMVDEAAQLTPRQFLQSKATDGVPTAKLIEAQYAEILEISQRVKVLTDLSLDEYRKVNGYIKDLVAMGKKEIIIDRIAEKRLVEEFVTPIKAKADKTFLQKYARPTQREWLGQKSSKVRNSHTSITDTKHKLFAELKRAEFILREVDVWEEFGPAQRLIQTAKFAEDQKYQLGKVVREQWDDLLKDYAKSYGKRVLRNRFWDKVFTDSLLGDKLKVTREKMLVMAGMTGNAHNKAAMIKSIGVGEIAVNRFLRENMTKQDWAFVKSIWKMTDTMYDMVNTVHMRMRKAPIPKVDNYWPIIPDYFFTKKGVKQHIEDVFLDMPHLQKVSPAVQKRFFHARAGNADAIQMDFKGLAKHFRDVVHTVSHWEATADIAKVVNNKTFKTAVRENLGEHKYNVLKQWSDDLIQPLPVDAPLLRKMRANVTVAALGLKVATAMVQPFSAISAIPRVGATNLLWAYSNLIKSPRRFIQTINEVSEQMAARDNAWHRDIGDLTDMGAMTRFKKMGQLDRNAFFSLIRVGDKIGAYPTWYAGYRRGLQRYDGDADKALRFADRSVRMTQPQSSLKDLPNIMKGPEWKRSITMFYSYYNVLMNQTTELAQRARYGDAGFWEVASALNFMYILPPALISIAKEREIRPVEIAKNFGTHAVGGLPIVRDMMSAAVKGYDYTISPVQDIFEVGAYAIKRTGKTVQQVYEDDFELTKGDIYMGGKALGYGFGIPSAQALIITSSLMAAQEGEDINPLDIIIKRRESTKE